MNNSKYKDSLYEFRPVSDLKDMLDTSAEIYAGRAAYLIKEVLGGEYKPIYFPQVKSDVDSLGTKFIEMGLKGKKIAVIGENLYQWVLTYFATTNGTGVIVPLDRELPSNEIRNLLQRAEVSAIVFSRKMEPIVKEALKGLNGINYTINMSATKDEAGDLSLNKLIGEGKELLEAGNREFVDAKIDREAMCSLLFTSGTMGLAKGVMLSHKNLSANVYNMSKYVAIPDNYVGLSVLPMHHSYEMTCHILTGIYQGLTIAFCEGLKYIVKNLVESKATVMLGVPLVFESMHKKIWKQAETNKKDKKMRKMISVSRKLKLYNQPTIRKIFKDVHNATGGNIKLFIAGGAATNPKVIEDFEAMGFPMIQGYGMTECAPIIALNKDRYSKAASAGFQMPGTEVKIVEEDENGIGEIICRGESVMLGYFGDPVETDKVLKNGWLHTGDYGYFDKEGFLYISGRKKNVIITKNGKNIFPEEVEYYLTGSPYIEEVFVHGVDDEKTNDTIVKAEIYPDYDFIQEEKGSMTSEEIRAFMKMILDDINEQMPLYKRVKRFTVRRTEFEKTTTRKIKRFTEGNLSEEENTYVK
ncbi:MAG: AMP-binding protein [Peptostreptococcaceae bacterium]|nr:AMP-binding protein [Peptostreptococcaceae bacterium]